MSVGNSRDQFVRSLLGEARSGGALSDLREQARKNVPQYNVPTTREEDWRFTPLGPILEVSYKATPNTPVRQEQIEGFVLEEAKNSRLTFVNGKFAPELSVTGALGDGVTYGRLADVVKGGDEARIRAFLGQIVPAEDVFSALNQAHLSDDTPVVLVGRDVSVEAPIHLLYVTAEEGADAFATFPRALVAVESGSKATVIEDHVTVGEGTYFTSSVIENAVAQNATLNHIKVLRDSPNAFHIARTGAWVERGANYLSVTTTFGGRLNRHDIQALQRDVESHCQFHGLAMLSGEQFADTHSAMDHAKPHGTSDQIHKVAVADRSRAVFNGKIFVRPKAQKTAAEQMSRSLLLSKRASVDSKPQLEIFADDVRCTHGATIGQMEGDELFYLQSRGLSAQESRKVLTQAFAGEVINKIPVASLRASLHRALEVKLEQIKGDA